MKSTPKIVTRVPFYYGWVIAGAVALSMTASAATAAPVFSIFIQPWSDDFNALSPPFLLISMFPLYFFAVGLG